MTTLRIATPDIIASEVPGAIRHGAQLEDVTVLVCGNQCPDRNKVAAELVGAAVQVHQVGCLALCQKFGDLSEGAYVLKPIIGGSPEPVAVHL